MLAFCLALVPVVFGISIAQGADIEAGAWPEIDIWIGLDEEQRNRIYILKSFTNEPQFSYEEEVIGVSLDHRLNKRWSLRAGAPATSVSRLNRRIPMRPGLFWMRSGSTNLAMTGC